MEAALSGLEDRRVQAAEATIRNGRQALGYRPETVRGVPVGVTLGKAGGLADAAMSVERRIKADQLALLDHREARAG